MKSENKKKISTLHLQPKVKGSIKIAIVAGIVIFTLLLPKISSAISLSASGIAQAIFKGITSLVLSFFGLIVGLAGKFFDAALELGFKSHEEVITEGWKVTRDLSNMFFILFMVIVAFATILRFEKYGIRNLLPKVIAVALLINFSLVICKVFVDISNVSANFFIKDAKNGAVALGKEKASISGALVDGLNLTKVLLPVDCEDFRKAKEQCFSICAQSEGGPPSPGCINECKEEKEQAYQDCKEGLNTLKKAGNEATFGNMIVSTIFGSIILCIAAFVLFAGGIMLVIRIIFLWFLMMLVPFAFICYILPALKRISDDWWKKFIQYCFFAPAYAFFVWLAVKIAVEKKLSSMSALLNNTLAKEPTMNAFARSMENLIGFLFMGGILIGGLIAANKMGIAGADRALALGKKWGGGAVNWAKRTSMRPVKALGTTARAGALTAGAKLFGKESRIGRRMGARADQLRQAAAERPEHKKYRAMAERMSDTNILKEVETAKGPRAFIATQIAEKRGLLREEADRSTVRAGMRALRASGAQEEARRLEEFRPDAIENKNERTAAEQRAFKEGIHKKWSGKVLEGARGAEIIEEMRGQLGTGEFTKVYKGWARNVKDKAEQALRANFTANFTDRNNMERRKVYAEATGEPNRAFFGDQNGVIQTTYRADPNAQNQARIHIRSLKDEGIGELKTNDDKALAAAYMIPSQVYGAGTKLSGRDKRLMKLIAKKYNPDPETHARMVTADTWK